MNGRDYSHTFGKVQRNFGGAQEQFQFPENKTNNSGFLKVSAMEDNTKILSGKHIHFNPEREVERRLTTDKPAVEREEVSTLRRKNEKLVKENSLFKEEYRVLMSTIKNLQSEVSKSKTSGRTENSKGLKAIESQKLKRQYEFLMKENQRLKNMNETMKSFSREDFSKILEMNTYYKMLNQELQGYVHELKGELSKEPLTQPRKRRSRCIWPRK